MPRCCPGAGTGDPQRDILWDAALLRVVLRDPRRERGLVVRDDEDVLAGLRVCSCGTDDEEKNCESR